MSSLKPRFTRRPSGELVWQTAVEDPKDLMQTDRCLPHADVWRMAEAAAAQLRGDRKASHLEVLGQVQCQLGRYRGATLLWIVQNRLGYAAWLVNDLKTETPSAAPLSINKHQLKRYLLAFPEGKEAVAQKKRELARKFAPRIPSKAVSGGSSAGKPATVGPSSRPCSTSAVTADKVLAVSGPSCAGKSATVRHSSTSAVAIPQLLAYDAQLSNLTEEEEMELAHIADKMESGHDISVKDDFPLPEGWRKSLNSSDHQWISKALFRWSKKSKPELDMAKVDRVWYHPPAPSPRCPQAPHPARYFARRLCLWMPVKLWQCRLVCPRAECKGRVLTQCGLYHTVRKVLDVDCFYNLAGEYLECHSCKGKLISWSLPILDQLDLGHRLQFPAILTYHYACDLRVITLVRQRGVGNGPMQLMKKLREQHSAAWLRQTALYLTDIKKFCAATERGMVTAPSIGEPPKLDDVPTFRWLLSVYTKDVLERLPEVKAAITNTFGSILKMDSTKKIVKKLSGKAAGSAAWMTSVGNEFGQVLTSVLTSHEGDGLRSMQEGLVKRYADAKVPPPKVLYVDRDCCSSTGNTLQVAWPDLVVRLDVWHFMRRIASGVTTDSHPLYRSFMGGLSKAIFQWDRDDLSLLKEAKKKEMVLKGITDPGDDDVLRRVSRRELALHCRRRTRGVEDMRCCIRRLLEAYSSDYGRDTLGVPLLDADRIWTIWRDQEKHLGCLQDPSGVRLYTETGTTSKGGVTLRTFRCARGSTSLESFHLHLNRFIPGYSAQEVHFQAYLLEGLARWNQDRAAAIAPSSSDEPWSYSARLRHGVNLLAQEVLKRPIIPGFLLPQKYTGELIGVEYLYGQTTQLEDSDSLDAFDLGELPDPDSADEGFEDEDDETVTSATDAWSAEPVPDTDSTATRLCRRPPQTSAPASSKPDLMPAAVRPRPSRLERAAYQIQVEQQPSTSSSLDLVPAALETAASTLQPPVLESQPEEQASTSESVQLEPPSTATPEVTLDPHNIPGLDKVFALADRLVALKDQSALTSAHAGHLISLYQKLDEYDRRAIVFPRRHQKSLLKGRFARPKAGRTTVTSGVESVQRCFVGKGSPAQSPSVSRNVEAIVLRLCDRYPRDIVRKGTRRSRWRLIVQAYLRIRQLVLGCPVLMAQTGLQLPEINQRTLGQWHDRRTRQQEEKVLEMGIPLQPPQSTTTCPPASQAPRTLQMSSAPKITVHLPENSAGQANFKRLQAPPQPPPVPPQVVQTSSGQPVMIVPRLQGWPCPAVFRLNPVDSGAAQPPQTTHRLIAPKPILTVLQPHQPIPFHVATLPTHPSAGSRTLATHPCAGSGTLPTQPSAGSRTTAWRRKRAMEENPRHIVKPRKVTSCGLCKQERGSAHRQYYGQWWCPEKSSMSFEEWMQAQRAARSIKKKDAGASTATTRTTD